MKKRIYFLMILVFTLSMFVGCSNNSKETPTNIPVTSTPMPQKPANTPIPNNTPSSMKLSNPEGDTWTVLVYLCGTDLETNGGFASINIAEMTMAAQSENVNVIFQTGGTQKWAIEDISADELQRWKVVPDNIELVDSQPLANMGEADTLGSFLKWGVEQYPADKYMCLLWDHGGGSVAGIAVDELFGNDTLDLRELSQGIAAAGVQFELVGFDACLMSTLETAAALSPYARYMVASQELEPGTGWDYTTWVSAMVDTPTATGMEVGRVICDSFYEKCAQGSTESLATLSVTDLSKIPELVQSFDQMAAEMKGFTAAPEKLQPLTKAMTRAESFGGNNDNEGYTNMVDLGDLILCAEGILSQTGKAVMESLSDAIVYNIVGDGRKKSQGLSVYVPLKIGETELDAYANLAAVSGEYLRFFEGLYDWKVPTGITINQPTVPQTEQPPTAEKIEVDNISAAESIDKEMFEVRFKFELTEDGYVLLMIDEGADIISSVAYNLYYLDEESNSINFLGKDFDVNIDGDGTSYWDNFRNVWPVINDNTCSMLALDWTDEYILYTVPVKVNNKETNLRMIYHYATSSYEIVGTWEGINEETGMSGREIKKLKKGDKVEFLFESIDMETSEISTFTFGEFTVDGDIIVEEADLFDGVFYYQYEITDIFGKVYKSDFAALTSKNGEISVEIE